MLVILLEAVSSVIAEAAIWSVEGEKSPGRITDPQKKNK